MYIVLASSRIYSAQRQAITRDDDDDEELCRQRIMVGSKSHCRAVPSQIWCASNLIFIMSSKLAYEVKNCNDIMSLARKF